MTQRTKLLWLIKGLGLGGAEKLLSLSLPYLDRSRFDYEIAYLLPNKADLVPELERAGLKVFCLNQTRSMDPRVVYKLGRLIRERRPDVLHTHLPYAGIMGAVATRIAPVKATVYTEHSGVDNYRRLTSIIHRRTYSWNDAIICVSDAVRESLVSSAGGTNGRPRLMTIHNGVDWAEIRRKADSGLNVRRSFGIPPNNLLVVTVANFRPEKRYQDLIEAAGIVLRRRRDVTFLLVGDGPIRPEMERMVERLGISRNVKFAGTREDAVSIVARCDVFALASEYEGLGIAVLEALALRRPVVVTKVGGIPEIVRHGTDGLLVEPYNPAAFAAALSTVLDDAELRRRLSAAPKESLEERFGIARMVSSVEQVYLEVLNGKAG